MILLYFASPNGLLGYCDYLPDFTMFWSYGPFTVVSHSLFEQLVPRVVEFNFWCCDELGILGFEEWANRANVFPVFPDWSKGCLNNVCTRYTLESVSRCV